MMQRYDEYDLHLAFAQPDGQYLAGVKVDRARRERKHRVV